MAVAARLRVRGHHVTLLEQAETYGGKARQYRRDGFVFDTGPSLLTLPAVYRDLFLKTGKALEDTVDLQPVEPGTSYRWAAGTHATVPGVGITGVAAALGDALGGTAADDWRTLMRRAAHVWRLTRKSVLESELSGPKDLFSLASSMTDIRTVAPWQTLRGIGNRNLRDPRLVTFLDRYATYSGSDPRKAPAALVTIPYVEQNFGSWHVGGGIGSLVTALFERCLERGVTVEFNADVERIEIAAGRVTAVLLTSGRRLPADVVVSDADATHLYADLLTDPSAAKPLKQINRATPSFSGFVILAAVTGRTPGIAHHNVWFPTDYDDEFNSVFAGRPASDPTIYACVPADPAMKPDGEHESWFILVNAPRHGQQPDEFDWRAPDVATQYATAILSKLATRGVDLRDRLLWSHVRTPADLETESRAPGGAIYGTSSNGVRAAFLRPANRSPIPGLFLVGGSSHPGGGLPLVGMSAELVANLVGRAVRPDRASAQ